MKASANTSPLLTHPECVSTVFRHPEKGLRQYGPSLPVIPVFMPFAGCRTRCVFCSQEMQTGVDATISPQNILADADERLAKREAAGLGPAEIAFYGGTFTALPLAVQDSFLDLAEAWKKRGMLAAVRCSTRPDAVDAAVLERLARRGMTMVEFGVQSFDACALSLSGRNYTGEIVAHAARLVKEAGLGLGIQLMPGMPGVDEAVAEEDVRQAIGLLPDVVRLYPCLVMEGTELAGWWRKGVYSPWSLERTREFLSGALLAFWEKDIPVIRMGVAPSDGLDAAVLAGPVHPSLGSMARGRALFRVVEQEVLRLRDKVETEFAPLSLKAPRRYQGEFFGYRGELKADYERLGFPGVSKTWVPMQYADAESRPSSPGIAWHDGDEFVLSLHPSA